VKIRDHTGGGRNGVANEPHENCMKREDGERPEEARCPARKRVDLHAPVIPKRVRIRGRGKGIGRPYRTDETGTIQKNAQKK